MAGDPFGIAKGEGAYDYTDVSLPSTLGAIDFKRHFVTDPAIWTSANSLGTSTSQFLPTPFGSASGNSLQWWHSLYTLIAPRAGGGWSVRYGNGQVANFLACTPTGTPSGCFAPVAADSKEVTHKLYWNSTNDTLTLYRDDGRYVYGAKWTVDNVRYFLSSIETPEYATPGLTTRTRAVLTYAPPAGLSCPGAGNGGVPYLSRLTTAEGAQLRFDYGLRWVIGSRAPNAQECVLQSVLIFDRGTGYWNYLTWYGYDALGHLASVDFYGRQGSSGVPHHAFNYSSGAQGFTVTENGLTTLAFDFAADGVSVVSQSSANAGASTATLWSRTAPPTGCPALTSCVVSVVASGGTSGDGTGTAASLLTTPSLQAPSFAQGHRVAASINADGGTGSEWRWMEFTGGLATNTAVRNENGAWSGQTVLPSTADFGGATFTTPVEVWNRFSGASNEWGTGAVEMLNYAYNYGDPGAGTTPRAYEQLLASEWRPSLLGTNGEQATVSYEYTAQNDLAAVIKSGYVTTGQKGTHFHRNHRGPGYQGKPVQKICIS